MSALIVASRLVRLIRALALCFHLLDLAQLADIFLYIGPIVLQLLDLVIQIVALLLVGLQAATSTLLFLLQTSNVNL